ncbi:MAG: PilZ domain-containing protein [Myxococcales bacterium]|nr:PilZ domain-containing protein [Myxococcales bacterium]
MTALDRVYQYRLLLGKAASGAGLTFDEIEALTALEAAFAEDASPAVDGRRFRREHVRLPAVVRGGKLHDAITVDDIGPGGMVCGRAPYAEIGSAVEIIIDDVELGLTYRFKARVQWTREDGDDYLLGFAWTGTPVLLRHGNSLAADPALSKLAA